MPAGLGWRPWLAIALILGAISLPDGVSAQSSTDEGAASASEEGGEQGIDRGKMRLNLLMSLVENERQEATLLQSTLTGEAARLDQERRKLLAAPKSGSKTEERQLAVIDERLATIDRELADVGERLVEIESERAELQARIDEANGVVPEAVAAGQDTNGAVVDESSRWLDSKRQIQEALVYIGGYNALIDGDFGPRTREAVAVYQDGQGATRTGRLTDDQEATLLKTATTHRTRYGVKTIQDNALGYRVTYPSALLTEETTEPGVRRFATADGEAELVLTASGGDDDGQPPDAFATIYDDLLRRYEVQYRRKRDDWFVVAGIADNGRVVYDTARLDNDRLVRAQLSYPAEWRELWSPFAVIMFNSFEATDAAGS